MQVQKEKLCTAGKDPVAETYIEISILKTAPPSWFTWWLYILYKQIIVLCSNKSEDRTQYPACKESRKQPKDEFCVTGYGIILVQAVKKLFHPWLLWELIFHGEMVIDKVNIPVAYIYNI
jgi:hypothetical protein